MSAYLPWLFILACPLMMMWMMRGMGHGGDKTSAPNNPADAASRDRGVSGTADADGPGARIAALEREVAELRGGRVRLDKSPHGGSGGLS